MMVLVATPAVAQIFSTVKGVVHDSQHRPVAGAVVTVKARQADWTQTTKTDTDGSFQFTAVAVGDYVVTVTLDGFNTAEQPITVAASTVPVLHIQLELAGVHEVVTVAGSTSDVHSETVTPTTLVDRQDIQNTPGADRSNSLEAITAFVPGAYVTHDSCTSAADIR